MSYFEYKVVPAPSARRWGQRRVDGLDKYASTVADMMTELGLEGWDFVGAEALRERRRKFFVLICDVERTLMIFRRRPRLADFDGADERKPTTAKEASLAVQATSDPVKPRRVKRPELIEAVANGARRIAVTRTEVPDPAEANALKSVETETGIARAVKAAKQQQVRSFETTKDRGNEATGANPDGVAAE